jgi:predicted dehydrogenase
MSILLVGAGQMAVDYAEVLVELDADFQTIGRSDAAVEAFRAATGLPAESGGIDLYLTGHDSPTVAIIAVDIPNLPRTTRALLEAGATSILVEKPAGLTSQEVQGIALDAAARHASVFVAYNRRFYASTNAARKMVDEDGGLLAVDFEFTEWADRVAESMTAASVKQRWIIANSSHVIDLAFSFAGMPSELHSWRIGSLPWHDSGARFVGAGVTDRDVPFSYHATWDAPGRWGVTLRTPARRLRLQPMEELQESTDGVRDRPVDLDDELDRRFKPGLLLQVASFLAGGDDRLCSIGEHAAMMQVYSEIAGYHDG